ncbi:MAG: archaetidylserine decarboxylase [Acidobacteriota bacterium]
MENSAPKSHRLPLALLRLLPKHLVSRLGGLLVSVPVARPLRAPLWGAIGRRLGVDFSEIVTPLAEHRCFQEFFTRPLAEWARPVDADPRALVAPCDGAWGQAGQVDAGTLLQVKGRPYRVADLLGEDPGDRFDGGAYATLYLSPRDYHRFHAPCRMRIRRLRHLPGALWPVNRIGVEGVDGLFAINERMVAFADALDVDGEPIGELALVAVGATMVGKVRVTFDSWTTQDGRAVRERVYDPPIDFAKGVEWGRFEFGSTIVLVAEPSVVDLVVESTGTPLRLGRRIGTIPT